MFNQLTSKGINIPDGFALSADAYSCAESEIDSENIRPFQLFHGLYYRLQSLQGAL